VSCPLPDDEPRFARIFDDFGVDRKHCHQVPTVPRLWILNSARGRRILTQDTTTGTELERPGPATHRTESHDPLPAPGAGFEDGLDGLVASSPAERPATGPKTRVGLDPHQILVAEQGLAYLRRVVSATTVLLPSRVQLSLLDSDPRRAARSLAAELGLPVIARLDAEGSYVVTADGVWSVRDRAVTVVETTGAGDAGAAAAVAALAAGAEPVEAALFGTSIARIALAGWGHEALVAAAPLSRPLSGITTRKEN
jgi:hypothetical protein